MRAASRSVILASICLAWLSLAPSAALAQSPELAVVSIEGPSRVDPDAKGFDLSINVENATNLGGFEIRLIFDAAIIKPDTEGEFGAATKGEFLGSTGRDVICPKPEEQGSLALIRCVSLGMEPAAASGDGTLAVFHFVPVAEGESPLGFSQARLISPDGSTDYEVDATDTTIRIGKSDGGSRLLVILGAVALAIVAVGGGAILWRVRTSRATGT